MLSAIKKRITNIVNKEYYTLIYQSTFMDTPTTVIFIGKPSKAELQKIFNKKSNAEEIAHNLIEKGKHEFSAKYNYVWYLVKSEIYMSGF